MSKVRARLIITGIVQGVGFRYFVCLNARKLGINGYVGNTPAGGVETVFEGEKAGVQSLVNLCRRGPRAACVEGLDVVYEEFKAEFTDFRITG